MNYGETQPGVFIARPNRFVAYVDVGGEKVICHVKNTGRLKELLLPGAEVLVKRADNPQRKTPYDLLSVYKGAQLVNIDSHAPNRLFAEWLPGSGYWADITGIKPESKWGNSRFDFRLEAGGQSVYVEVKGVTLEQGGVAMFPDAPTLRGVKHVNELAECTAQGHRAAIVFIIQMKGVDCFRPNDRMHPEFGTALRAAAGQGVELLALDCVVRPGEVRVDSYIPIML